MDFKIKLPDQVHNVFKMSITYLLKINKHVELSQNKMQLKREKNSFLFDYAVF